MVTGRILLQILIQDISESGAPKRPEKKKVAEVKAEAKS
jgi:hypothetical protein